MTKLETNKELEEAVKFCMKRIIPNINSRIINPDYEDMLVNSLDFIKKKNEPVELEHVLDATGIQNTMNYKMKVGALLAKHAYTGYLGIDRSGLIKIKGNGHYPSEFVWDVDYAQKLERKRRDIMGFDKHANVLLENHSNTITALAAIVPECIKDFERAEAVFYIIKEIIEVNGVGKYAVSRHEYMDRIMHVRMEK